MKSKRLNITWAIEQFLLNHCSILKEDQIDIFKELYDGTCIKYEEGLYFIPNDAILMDENDDLLKTMLIATFKIE